MRCPSPLAVRPMGAGLLGSCGRQHGCFSPVASRLRPPPSSADENLARHAACQGGAGRPYVGRRPPQVHPNTGVRATRPHAFSRAAGRPWGLAGAAWQGCASPLRSLGLASMGGSARGHYVCPPLRGLYDNLSPTRDGRACLMEVPLGTLCVLPEAGFEGVVDPSTLWRGRLFRAGSRRGCTGPWVRWVWYNVYAALSGLSTPRARTASAHGTARPRADVPGIDRYMGVAALFNAARDSLRLF